MRAGIKGLGEFARSCNVGSTFVPVAINFFGRFNISHDLATNLDHITQIGPFLILPQFPTLL
jgi:hypothetical protein